MLCNLLPGVTVDDSDSRKTVPYCDVFNGGEGSPTDFLCCPYEALQAPHHTQMHFVRMLCMALLLNVVRMGWGRWARW